MCVVVAMSQSSGLPQGVVELCVGLCSWSEPCLIECKRFFPPACKGGGGDTLAPWRARTSPDKNTRTHTHTHTHTHP